MRGDLAVGERLAERAVQISQEAGQSDAVLICGGQPSFARQFQGRAEEGGGGCFGYSVALSSDGNTALIGGYEPLWESWRRFLLGTYYIK